MTALVIVHAAPEAAALCASALGASYVVRVQSRGSQFSAGYDVGSETRNRYPTLASALAGIPDDVPVVVLGYSAGCWLVRHWMASIEARDRTEAIVLLDGWHCRRGASGAKLGPADAGLVAYARAAAQGARVLILSHTQIEPGAYPSTRETASLLLAELGKARRLYSETVQIRGLHVLAHGGIDAAAHAAQLREVGPRILGELVAPRIGPPPRRTPLEVCLAEAARWGSSPVSVDRVCEYLSTCVRDGSPGLGRWLAQQHRAGHRQSFCAAAQGWAEAQASGPVWGPSRAGARELERDAQAAGYWRDIESIRAGRYLPQPGDLIVSWRSPQELGLGHVERVIRADSAGCETVGANEAGGRWVIAPLSWGEPHLLGAIVRHVAEPTPDTIRAPAAMPDDAMRSERDRMVTNGD